MYRWLIFLHVAAVLAFMLAHSSHVAAMWRMRAEADPEVSLTLFNTLSTALPLRVLPAVIVGSGCWLASWVHGGAAAGSGPR